MDDSFQKKSSGIPPEITLQGKLYALRRQEEEKRAQALAKKNNLIYLNLAITPIEPDAVALLSEKKARESKTAVFKVIDDKVWLAVLSPNDANTKKVIQELEKAGYRVNVAVTSPHSLEKVWQAYGKLPALQKEITGKVQISLTVLEDLQKEIETVADIQEKIKQYLSGKEDLSGLVEIIIAGAIKTEASDIHLENKEKEALVRYRIDGILHDVVFLSKKIYNLVLSRIKLLSGIKLNIKEVAQDGRFTIEEAERSFEVRVSSLPGHYGENIAMRILEPERLLDLNELGLREDLLAIVKQEIRKPDGMLIITGPTGSGKTTSLCSFLKKINSPEIKIITLEDPIEYRLPGIIQTQVETEQGYTFAHGLRAALRQDPDVILVGEIRDDETAQVSLRAASTGHLVFSTLHTNDAATAIPYLVELGIKPTFLAGNFSAIIAQRLVRRVCPKCREEYKPGAEELAKLKNALGDISPTANLPQRGKISTYGGAIGGKINIPALDKNLTLAKGKGCPFCNKTGFSGRIGIFELILVTEELQKLINTNPSQIQIKELAQKQGMLTMYQDGLIKVAQKITTLEEVERLAQ